MTEQTIPQDLEQKLVQINKEIIKKVNQGADKDKTRRNEVLEALEKLFLATPLEYLEVVHDQTIYLPFQYFNFYNKWFTPENAPHPQGYYFDDWVVNGTKDIKFIQRNLGQKLEGILEQIGRYSDLGLLKDGIGSIAEELRKKYREEIAGRYLSIIKSRFDQSFRERDLSIVKYLHKAKERQHTQIQKREQLNEIGRRFEGYINQTFEFVNGLPTLFNRVNRKFYSILFQEPVPIKQTYQDFADFVVEANGKLITLMDSLNRNKKYESEKLFSLLSKVGGREFYKQSFLDNVIRLAEEGECKSEEEIIEIAPKETPDYILVKKLGEGAFKTAYLGKHILLNYMRALVYLDIKALGLDLLEREGISLKDAILGELKSIELNDLNHPNIIKTYDVHSVNEDKVLNQDPFDITLAELLKQKGRLEIREMVHYIIQITDALAACHKYRKGPIIHRDLKMSNMGLKWDQDEKIYNAFLTDFGILQSLSREPEEHSSLCSVDTKPPELYDDFKGSHQITTRSNVFSLGTLYFEIYASFPPFVPFVNGVPMKKPEVPGEERRLYEKGTKEGIDMLARDDYKKLHERIEKYVPIPELRPIIKECLRYNPNERSADASVVLSRIKKVFNK